MGDTNSKPHNPSNNLLQSKSKNVIIEDNHGPVIHGAVKNKPDKKKSNDRMVVKSGESSKPIEFGKQIPGKQDKNLSKPESKNIANKKDREPVTNKEIKSDISQPDVSKDSRRGSIFVIEGLQTASSHIAPIVENTVGMVRTASNVTASWFKKAKEDPESKTKSSCSSSRSSEINPIIKKDKIEKRVDDELTDRNSTTEMSAKQDSGAINGDSSTEVTSIKNDDDSSFRCLYVHKT